MKHWTERSDDDFLYRITADFVAQLENKIASESLNKSELARKLGISKGRISQILNNPGNLSLKTIIKCARALGMKIAIVAYDDKDPHNEHGPIDSEIFRICWEKSGKPADFWSLEDSPCAVTSTGALHFVLDYSITNVLQSSQNALDLTWNDILSERQHAVTIGSDLRQTPKIGELENWAITETFGQSSADVVH